MGKKTSAKNAKNNPKGPVKGDVGFFSRLKNHGGKITLGAIAAVVTILVTSYTKPAIVFLDTKASVSNRSENAEQVNEVIVFNLKVRNYSPVRGFIDKVEITPLNATSKKTKMEVLGIDKGYVYPLIGRSLELRIKSIVWTDDALTKDDPEFRIQAYDNFGQQIGGDPVNIKIVSRLGKRLARLIKDPSPLYEALRSQKVVLHFDDTDERNRISRILDAGGSKTDGFFKIAAMYEKGEGVPMDQVEALHWYQKAAANGHDIAYARVARLSDALFSAEAIRKKVLIAFYVIDSRRRLKKASYTLIDRGTSITKESEAEMSSRVPSVPGWYKVITCINPDKRIEESDTRNNCEEVEFQVLPNKSMKQQSR